MTKYWYETESGFLKNWLNKCSFSECESFLDVGLSTECASKEGVLQRGSGSDSDLFHSPSDEMDSIIFSKVLEEPSIHFDQQFFYSHLALLKPFFCDFPLVLIAFPRL